MLLLKLYMSSYSTRVYSHSKKRPGIPAKGNRQRKSAKNVITEGNYLEGSKKRVCYNPKYVISENVITGIFYMGLYELFAGTGYIGTL